MIFKLKKLEDLDVSNSEGPKRFLLYYNSKGLVENPGVVEWLFGRKGIGPGELAKLMVEEQEDRE